MKNKCFFKHAWRSKDNYRIPAQIVENLNLPLVDFEGYIYLEFCTRCGALRYRNVQMTRVG